MNSTLPSSSLNSLPIGVFDSGFGGLTVMKAISELLPEEALLYLGDTARVPYGNKAHNTVTKYSVNNTKVLISAGIKALVIACNTASAYALETLTGIYPEMPVLGVIEPVAKQAAKISRTGTIGVIGTTGTVASNSYPEAIKKLRPDSRIIQTACPLFVPLAEEDWLEGDVPRLVAERYLSTFKAHRPDTLILGCTHYPLLRDIIGSVMHTILGNPVVMLDSAYSTANHLKAILTQKNLLAPTRETPPDYRFLVTDAVAPFKKIGLRFFGKQLASVTHVDIQNGNP